MGKQILIVDDSSFMRKMISKTLEDAGHQVVGEARSGLEAVNLYTSLRPEVVTMDVTMRDMDGFAAARKILSIDSGARIIFLSNLDEEVFAREAETAGGIAFVNKRSVNDILGFI